MIAELKADSETMSEKLQKRSPSSVVHIFRAPVGGLFRHVSDLIRGQKKLGLKLGLICDATTGDDHVDSVLSELEPLCELGIHRVPMSRSLGWSDITAFTRLVRICKGLSPDILHGHGAKGGAYARLVANRVGVRSVYTPHGGSLHYSASTPTGLVYLSLERLLRRCTHGLIFESQFSADAYVHKVGSFPCAHQVIHNGLHDEEFVPIVQDTGPKDFVFVGEIRKLKGLESLLQAVNKLRPQHKISLLLAGEGPDVGFFRRYITELGLDDCVTMSPAVFPATRAFAQGKCVVVPSLADSFPYIVLEAAAARVPLLTTNVGGIPEIFGPFAEHLLPPGDADALAYAMEKQLGDPRPANGLAESLQAHVQEHFTVEGMVHTIIKYYGRVLTVC